MITIIFVQKSGCMHIAQYNISKIIIQPRWVNWHKNSRHLLLQNNNIMSFNNS